MLPTVVSSGWLEGLTGLVWAVGAMIRDAIFRAAEPAVADAALLVARRNALAKIEERKRREQEEEEELSDSEDDDDDDEESCLPDMEDHAVYDIGSDILHSGSTSQESLERFDRCLAASLAEDPMRLYSYETSFRSISKDLIRDYIDSDADLKRTIDGCLTLAARLSVHEQQNRWPFEATFGYWVRCCHRDALAETVAVATQSGQ